MISSRSPLSFLSHKDTHRIENQQVKLSFFHLLYYRQTVQEEHSMLTANASPNEPWISINFISFTVAFPFHRFLLLAFPSFTH